MPSIIIAILLDPEARSGDSSPTASDGFLQDPMLYQTWIMSLLQMTNTDNQPLGVPGALGEPWTASPTVFNFYSPSYLIPGTTINSPEFQLLNNMTLVQRSQYLWSMVEGLSNGFAREPKSYLLSTYKNVPDMVDALNHMLMHGAMPAATQQAISSYAQSQPTSKNPNLPIDSAIFLALNSDSYQVAH
jgi:hypothetical protein